MTQEEKELVIKEFCARLPYGLKLNFYSKATNENYVCTLLGIEPDNEKPIIAKTEDGAFTFTQDHVKPYLRPMSSMTEEEKKTLNNILEYQYCSDDSCMCESTDWLNAHHFDYRGLIEKGLALPAKENMYND
jgi:hypothetical protein